MLLPQSCFLLISRRVVKRYRPVAPTFAFNTQPSASFASTIHKRTPSNENPNTTDYNNNNNYEIVEEEIRRQQQPQTDSSPSTSLSSEPEYETFVGESQDNNTDSNINNKYSSPVYSGGASIMGSVVPEGDGGFKED